ncbi:hypothetical protein [Nesterenkonia ebinurensis]|uniref:hypothetical protein n=1 Tax=Nesterenkonia ebinurensis TaxID=2608252 RepID=UPI00123CDAED|nr:hypothetical protein [Nesterenkonia ebinurensis]
MTLGLRLTTAGIIEMIPSLPIHSSVLIPLVVGLFLAALILRAQRLPRQPVQHNPGLTSRQARTARRRVLRSRAKRAAHATAERTETRGAQMTARNTKENNDAAGTSTGGFRIYWGRTIFALVGALALLGGLGTALLATFTATVTWLVPALCAAALLVCLVSLQITAALRRRAKRRARVERAMLEAMNAGPEVSAPIAQRQRSAAAAAAGLGIVRADSAQPFDALSSDEAGHGGPDSLISRDADGLPDSAERLFGEKKPQADPVFFDQAAAAPAAPEDSWELREVPAAKYMVAEKAERPEPEEIEQPAPTPASSVKLKQPAAAAVSPAEPAKQTAVQQQLNLDSVLARRRA